jgi:hypothetical protein
MARVPLEDLPSNLVPSNDLPLELPTINVVPENDLPSSVIKKERSATERFGRGLSSIARGAAVPVTGAIAGGALAGPPGAIAGSLALPAAELVTKGLNTLLPDRYDISSPTALVEKGLTRLGFPQPETRTERMLQVGGGGLGGVGGQVGALGRLAQTATSPVARGVAQTLSQQPVRQVAASLPVGAVSQYVTEESGSPLAGAAAGILTGIPFAIGAKGKVQAPTVQELKGQAGQQYKFAEEAGAVFKKDSYNQFANKLESTLAKEGLDKTLQPRVFAALERIKDTKNSNVSLENMEILRRIGQSAGSSIDASERRLASILVDNLDDFVENAQSAQLTKGSPEAITALTDARELWKRAKKTEIIDDLKASAELRAEANYNQSGIENALRRKLVNLADNPRKLRAFSKEEQELIKSTAKGGSVQNALRLLGKLSPTGAIPAAISGGAGFALGGPYGAVLLPLLGGATRQGATQLGLRNIEQLRNRLALGYQPIPQVSTRGLIGSREAIAPIINPITGLLSEEQ